jgi:hypothetical protein
VKEILGQERWKLGTLAWPDKWPKDCGSDVWDEPDYLGKSQCYDLLWRITLVREPAKDGKDVTLKKNDIDKDDEKIRRFGWRAASLTVTLEGFRGNDDDPCSEGLTPVDPTQPLKLER